MSRQMVTVVLFFAVIGTGSVDAATYRWLGGGTDNNWGNSSNWEFGVIAPTVQQSGTTTDVFMRGSGGTSDLADIFNNDARWELDSLTFEGAATGGITLIGGELRLLNIFNNNTRRIRNSDGNTHTFQNLRVELWEPNTNFDADIGDLDFDAPVRFENFSGSQNLSVTGGNDVFFDGGLTSNGGAGIMSVSEGTTAHIRSSASGLSQVNLSGGGILRIGSNSNLGDAVNISTSAGTTFDINNFTENVDQITGSGTVDLGSGSLTFGDSSNFTFSGSVIGTGSLTKNQSGVTTLSGVSTYSGATNITQGTLRLNNATSDGSLSSATDVSISAGGTFDLNGVTDTVDSVSGSGTILLGGGELIVDATSGTEVFTGGILESGTLRKLGNHTLTLNGANGFSSLIVAQGMVAVSSSANLGASDSTLLLGGTLRSTASFTNPRQVFAANGTFDINSGHTFTQSGIIQNNTSTSSVNKSGAGTLVYGASNTYTGDTIVNAGRLEINSNERINNLSDLLINSGIFDLNNHQETVGGLQGSGSVVTGGSSGRLLVNQSESRTYAGTISGAGGLTKQGTGVLTLSGSNTYDGSTSVTGGTLRLTSGGSLDSTTDVSVTGSGTFDLNGISDTVDSISGNGSITLGGANLTVDQSSGTTTFSGAISESGSLSKTGGHKLVLSGNNTFDGGTSIFGGSVSVQSDSNLGAGSGDVVLAVNGELETTGTFTTSRDLIFGMAADGRIDTAAGTTLTHNGQLSGGSDVTFRKLGDGTYVMNAANAGFGGDIVIDDGTFEIGNFSGDALGNATRVTVNSGATLENNQVEGFGSLAGAGNVVTLSTLEVGFDNSSTTYSGVISSSGSGGFVGKAGTGIMTITQPQTYAQRTEINNGTLRLSGNGGLPDNTDLEVTGTFDLNTESDTIDALSGTGSVLLGTGALTVGNNNGSGTFSGTISEAGSTLSGSLVKVGSGTQTLSGNNTYTNATRIHGGTLQINNSNNLGSNTIVIANGAELAVTGTTSLPNNINLQSGGGVIDTATFQTITQNGTINGVGGLTKQGAGTLVLSGNTISYGGNTSIDGGTLRLAGAGRLPDATDVMINGSSMWDLNGASDRVQTIAGTGSIRLGGASLTVDGDTGAPTYAGIISETGNLNKQGNHTLVLSGNNSFIGNVNVTDPGGALSISANANLGNSANPLTLDEGVLQTTASLSMTRAVELTANDGFFDVTTGALTLNGIVSGSGELFKRGPGMLVLPANNTYTGGTTVENGSVQIGGNAGLGLSSSTLRLANGTLVVVDEFANLHPIVISGSGTIDTTNQLHIVEGAISGTGSLTKTGVGELELDVNAAHQGPTIIEQGELYYAAGGGLPDAFSVTVDAGASWSLAGIDDTIDALTGAGQVRLQSSKLTLGGGGGSGLFSGTIQGAGDLVKVGAGTQTLTGNNSHSSTNINGGTLVINQDAQLGAASAPLGFDGGTLNTNGTFTMPRDVLLNSLGGTFDVDGGTTLTVANPVTGTGGLTKTGAGTLILLGNNNFGGPMSMLDGSLQLGTDMTFGGISGNGNIDIGLNELIVNSTGSDSYGGILSGVGGKLTKDGPGTLTLTGINTYTGGTCLLDGVLRVSQSENLGDEGSLLIFGGGTLNTTASFATTRGVTIDTAGGTFDVDAGTTLNASGQVSGLGSLTKTGDGVLMLSAISSYEGGTNVLGGEVSIVNNINLGNTSGQLTLDSGTLHVASNVTMARPTTLGTGGGTFRGDALTVLSHSGPISGIAGSAGLTKQGAGDLSLEGNNTFNGEIHIEEGRLQIDTSNRLGDASNLVRIEGGALHTRASLTNAREVALGDGPTANTIEVDADTTFTQQGIISGNSMGPFMPFVKTGSGRLRVAADNTYSSPTFINAGDLQLSGNGQLPDVTDVTVATGARFDLNNVSDAINALSGSGDVTLGTATLSVGAENGGGNFDGVISGTGGLTKLGTGVQQLRTREDDMMMLPNTYSGGTAINGGVLDVVADGNLGDPSGQLSFDGGTLRVAGAEASVNTTRAVILNVGGGTIDAGDMSAVTFNNVVSGVGPITKEGLGNLVYDAANTYTGDTTVNRGTLRLGTNGRIADVSNLIVNAPGEFNLDGVNDAVNGLSGNGGVLLGTGRLTVGAGDGDGDFTGVISGDGGITKSGAGVQRLMGTNTYLGSTGLDGGVLEVSLNAHLGDVASPLLFDGGTLRTTASFAFGRHPVLGAGGGSIETVPGTILEQTAPMTGVGGLTKLGTGTLRLLAANTYTGATQINAGIVELGAVERLSDATDLFVAGGATFDLSGFNESVDALSGAGDVLLGAAALNVGVDNGDGTFAGVISGTGDLLKLGAGTQTLSGMNTYSGATFVDGGSLVLTGGGQINQSTTVVGFNIGSQGVATATGMGTTWDLSGDLFVGLDGIGQMNIQDAAIMTVEGGITIGNNNHGPASAGTLRLDGGTLDNSTGNGIQVVNGNLQGHGTILGDVTSFATVAPGNSAGVLNITGNYIQSLDGTLAIEIGGTDNSNPDLPQFDQLLVNGSLGLDGLLDVALLNGFAPDSSDSFTIVSANTLAGTFSNASNGGRINLSGGGTGSFQVDYVGNTIVLTDFQGMANGNGDFDNNGTLEGADADVLVAAIASGSMDLAFDLTGDGMISLADLTEWLAVAGAANLPSGDSYIVGDANLDGNVDGQDFIAWNSNKFTQLAQWTGGDFNADGNVDGQDFIVWNSNKFTFADGSLPAVPEPSSWFGLVVMLIGFSRWNRSRRG